MQSGLRTQQKMVNLQRPKANQRADTLLAQNNAIFNFLRLNEQLL